MNNTTIKSILAGLLTCVTFDVLAAVRAPRMPVKTYLPIRAKYPNQSPFQVGKTYDHPARALWFSFNPPRVSNETDGDGFTLRRKTAHQIEERYHEPGNYTPWGAYFERKFDYELGCKMDYYQLNLKANDAGDEIIPNGWRLVYTTGWTHINPEMVFPGFWKAGKLAFEWLDGRYYSEAEGKIIGATQKRVTSTAFGLKANFPSLYPREVLLTFQGDWWPEPEFEGDFNTTPWKSSWVVLYPGFFSLEEMAVTPSVPKNNSIYNFHVSPAGLVIYEN